MVLACMLMLQAASACSTSKQQVRGSCMESSSNATSATQARRASLDSLVCSMALELDSLTITIEDLAAPACADTAATPMADLAGMVTGSNTPGAGRRIRVEARHARAAAQSMESHRTAGDSTAVQSASVRSAGRSSHSQTQQRQTALLKGFIALSIVLGAGLVFSVAVNFHYIRMQKD